MKAVPEKWDGHATERIVDHLFGLEAYAAS